MVEKGMEFVLLMSCAIPADDRDNAEEITSKISTFAKRLGCHSIDLEVGPGQTTAEAQKGN